MSTVAAVSVVLSAVDQPRETLPCEEDPELFYPVGTSGPALLQIAEAKRLCRRCPKIDRCLTQALTAGEDYGIWGGMSEDERRALRRRDARIARRSA